MQSEAVGRNHVEADAREQHHATGFRLSVPDLYCLENGDLAGDVQTVGAATQKGFDERRDGVFEWPGAVQYDRDIFQRAVDRSGIVEPKRAALVAGLTSDALDPSGVNQFRCACRDRLGLAGDRE